MRGTDHGAVAVSALVDKGPLTGNGAKGRRSTFRLNLDRVWQGLPSRRRIENLLLAIHRRHSLDLLAHRVHSIRDRQNPADRAASMGTPLALVAGSRPCPQQVLEQGLAIRPVRALCHGQFARLQALLQFHMGAGDLGHQRVRIPVTEMLHRLELAGTTPAQILFQIDVKQMARHFISVAHG
ncbi:hypothetical protein GALL_419240 [mine drainage metagenome]|uniref:Uncharacterized protein n=1 Tax=mine drainage metagenome TaxID=410659 RepID=A0A1J5PY38_9ZZZZ